MGGPADLLRVPVAATGTAGAGDRPGVSAQWPPLVAAADPQDGCRGRSSAGPAAAIGRSLAERERACCAGRARRRCLRGRRCPAHRAQRAGRHRRGTGIIAVRVPAHPWPRGRGRSSLAAGHGARGRRREPDVRSGRRLGPVRLASVGVSVLLGAIVLLTAFRFLTSGRPPWRDVAPGALAGAVGWSVLHAVGGLYVDRVVRDASLTYGAFAIVIGLRAWMYLQARLFLLAAELNVVLAQRLWPRSMWSDGDRSRWKPVVCRLSRTQPVAGATPPSPRTPARPPAGSGTASPRR